MKVKEIKVVLGGDVSVKNTKMPGTSFGLTTEACIVGSTLRDIEGSVCSKCYAHRLEKIRPSVKLGWQRRTDAVHEAIKSVKSRNRWIEAMVERLTMIGEEYHRWHDSGDIQSLEHLIMIAMVAEATPHIKHWLPTKEYSIVRQFVDFGYEIPDNLCIRLSSYMIGQPPTKHIKGVKWSMVERSPQGTSRHICPARTQGNRCGECRACWNKEVDTVSYPLH